MDTLHVSVQLVPPRIVIHLHLLIWKLPQYPAKPVRWWPKNRKPPAGGWS